MSCMSCKICWVESLALSVPERFDGEKFRVNQCCYKKTSN